MHSTHVTGYPALSGTGLALVWFYVNGCIKTQRRPESFLEQGHLYNCHDSSSVQASSTIAQLLCSIHWHPQGFAQLF
ncbi:hypothetical protein GALMADRAFT_226904 [Galerina marginata CBS 339.88]|uniref:Uncharacterized protein n=1 Tax=Galerina marginata (strain CBS 339.88) TaxID=685588 RepID=A0A067SWE5_GALM3|nr:hypothetical protein GALMADRAFT_226904 [Galerina marginata CBS 339.88]